MACKYCNSIMAYVMHCCNGKPYEFYGCPNCWWKSKKKILSPPGIEAKQEKNISTSKEVKSHRGYSKWNDLL